MRRSTNYSQMFLVTCLLLFVAQIFLAGCSSQKLQTSATSQELQTNSANEVVTTQPLIDGVEIPRDFFDELYPGYTRGITIVLSLPSNGQLSTAQLQEIDELFLQSKASGSLHQVHILAWGYDKNNRERSAAKALEHLRVAITPYLQKTTALISSHNMEDPPSWTSRMLMSKPARMKSYFSDVDKNRMFTKVIIGVSTTDRKTYVHPEMVSL